MSSPTLIARVLRKVSLHRTTDLYFVGYPKTGNTWLRYMLGRYVQLVCGLAEVPLFDAVDSWGCCESYCVGPAMQFTHRPLLWETQRPNDLTVDNVIRPFKRKRVVLLVRHPLDVIVSLWMQRRHRVKDGYDGTLPQMLEDPVWGIEKFFRFYTLWDAHSSRKLGLMLIRYEDMRAKPRALFRDLLGYLGIPVQEDAFARAVADADFESMKQVELSGSAPRYRSSGLNIFATGDTSNSDALHVRRGKVGGYTDYLEPKDIDRLAARIAERLPQSLGYGAPARATESL
jgi:hypothetical protein